MADPSTLPLISFRQYGASGPLVALLHGGPGGPGYMATLARTLTDACRVIEPFQRSSGLVPLTVARHIQDMKDLISNRHEACAPILIGHSWGAMLALAFAAAHPQCAAAIVLIGCGTFDLASRRHLQENLQRRAGPGFSFEGLWNDLAALYPDRDLRMRMIARQILPLHSVDLLPHEDETASYDAGAFEESWADMVRLQCEGVYPAAFSRIRCPAIMLHGAEDPHPGRMIFENLLPHVPQLEYQEFPQCGHYPWLERHAHADFLTALRGWLARQVR